MAVVPSSGFPLPSGASNRRAKAQRPKQPTLTYTMYRWFRDCEGALGFLERIALANPNAESNWTVGTIRYNVGVLSKLLQEVPAGCESSAYAYRQRLQATGL